MKRTILSLLLLAIVVCGATAQNDAMYIYRNDGVINAFLKTDIDSIRHSALDLDSVIHAENVTQEVWTVDSVYRIPLAAIDSVSFITPPTVYKEGVTRLEYNLLDYIIDADGLTLKLKTDTPTMILPVKGDKLVLLEGCEVLPYGFSGIVTTVQTGDTSIDVVCEQAYLEDLFDSFCCVSTVYGGNPTSPDADSPSNRQRAIYNPDDVQFSLGPYTATCSEEVSKDIAFNGDLAFTGGINCTVSVTPTFRIHTFLIMGEGQGTYFQCSITGSLQINSAVSIYGGLEYNHDFDGKLVQIPIPQTGNIVNFYIVPGIFLRSNAMIAADFTMMRKYTFGMGFDYSSKYGNTVKPTLGGDLKNSSTDVTGYLDGTLAGGGFIETGFNLLSREIAKVYVRGEMGWWFTGNLVLTNNDIENATKDTRLYERLKASSFETGPFVDLSVGASVAKTSASEKWEFSRTLFKWDFVPTFSNTTLTHTTYSSTSFDAYTELSGNCLFPVGVGYKLFDANMNEVANYDAANNYTNKECWMEHIFQELEEGERYKVYPKVKLFGHDVLASPEAELDMVMPEIVDFFVMESHYSKGAYYNDGIAYDYKFDAATTVEIESLDGVEDWGYVYKDLEGNIKHISLMQYGASYTDTSYSFYRNEAQSTVCLYGYVRYEGECYYGEPQVYELNYHPAPNICPDNNHPHTIDLGLPSGTKWCCCNVGASMPEDYGGYYAWGETSEKSKYCIWTYKYLDEDGRYMTKYGKDVDEVYVLDLSDDVAHVRMGVPWHMPSPQQMKELTEYCCGEWTSQNGINGILVTGPSGGQLFLPAAGFKWYPKDYYGPEWDNQTLYNYEPRSCPGYNGYYWSNRLERYMGYDDGIIMTWPELSGMYREYGLSVRAVCP